MKKTLKRCFYAPTGRCATENFLLRAMNRRVPVSGLNALIVAVVFAAYQQNLKPGRGARNSRWLHLDHSALYCDSCNKSATERSRIKTRVRAPRTD